ncbi:MAG: Ig-like domain-containing protein, partial [Myxococcaceae bacterium]|nr:Ig-like domain-containing protein [Myxococcaceae bacterium]
TGTLASHQLVPAVGCSSTQCLVVWQDGRSSTTGEYDIFGTFVNPTGVVSHPQGLPVSTAALTQQTPDVVSDGTDFLVVWEHLAGSAFDIRGAVVNASGTVVMPDIGLVVEPTTDQRFPVVAYDGTNYLLVWSDRRLGTYDINAQLVSRAGVPSPSFPISTAPGDQVFPAVSFDGSNHLVVWADGRSFVTYDVYGRHVPPGGVLGAAEFPISTGADDWEQVPTVASGAGGSLVLWQDDRNTRFGDDIFGARVTSGGTVSDPSGILVSTAANRQRDPAIAFDGTNFLVVWQDDRVLGEVSIRGTQVSPTGVVLDPTGIELSTAPGDTNVPYFPAIGFDGTHFLVVWRYVRSDAGDIYGARVTREGTVVEPGDFVISAGTGQQLDPSIAFDGANFLVVWADARSGSNDIYGARVSPGGSVLERAGIAISTATDAQLSPGVAFDGTNFLVVWEDQRAVPAGTEIADIFGARVTPAGVVLETGGTPIAQGLSNQVNPKVAFDGTHSLVVWEDNRSDVSDIYGARVTPGMSVLEPNGIPISTAVGFQLDLALAFDGDNYLVVWRDDRDRSFVDVYGARVSPSGSVLEPDGFVISSEPTSDHYHPAVASMGAGESMVVYTRFNLAPDVNADRVRGRIVSFPASNPPRPPVASPQVVQTHQGAAVAILLTGTDPDGDALTFSVVGPPSNGTLSGTAPGLLYAPSEGFAGVDSFTFKVNDGSADSAAATVHVVVQPVSPANQLPVPVSQVLATPEDTPLSLTLIATDVEEDAIRFGIMVAPGHGTLSGTPPNLTYHPAPNYAGPDSFTFTADDGRGLGAYGVISLDVTPRNDGPTCASPAVTVAAGSEAAVVLSASDLEQSALTFTVLTQPSHGTLSGAAPHFIYTPDDAFTGTDSFTYEANDGSASCGSTPVTLLVVRSGDSTREEPSGPFGCSAAGGARGISFFSLLGLWALTRMRRRTSG